MNVNFLTSSCTPRTGKKIRPSMLLALAAILYTTISLAQPINYPDFSSTAGLTLNGSAAQAGSALRLTPALVDQAGSAFTTNPITLGTGGSFSTHFSFQITNSCGRGADGLAFLVQNDGAGDGALGGAGGDIGYSGISPSLAVEYDSFFNRALGDPEGDASANHVGTGINGVVGSGIAVGLGAPQLDGGTVFYSWIDYNGFSDVLEVRLATVNVRPAAPTLSQAALGLVGILGGTSAHVGFTSGTGTSCGDHDVLSWHLSTPGLSKELTSGPDDGAGGIALAVEIDQLDPTEYDFTITYDVVGGPPVLIDDTVPAEWDVTDIEFDPTGLPLDCGEETAFAGIYGMVDVFRDGKPGKKCHSNTTVQWIELADNTLNVQTEARCHDNKKNKKCKPTSCGALYLNYGAIAYKKDGEGNLVLDQGELVVVAGPTDPICLVAVEDLDGGGIDLTGNGDEDGDGLLDHNEACDIGTDPCNPDTDDDGVLDGADECPLEGPPDAGLGEIQDPNGCNRQSPVQ